MFETLKEAISHWRKLETRKRMTNTQSQDSPLWFWLSSLSAINGAKRNWRSDASSLQWGRAELFSLCQGVPGWQGASCVCSVLPSACYAGAVSGEGPGRAVASTCKCVCDEREMPAAQGDVGSSQAEPAQGDAGDCRNLFICYRKAVAAVTSCRVWLQSCILRLGFIFLVLTLQGAFLGCVTVFWAWWTTTVLSKHQLFFFSGKTYTRLSFTHPIPQLFTQHLVFGEHYFHTVPQR